MKLIHSEKFGWEGVVGQHISIGNKASVSYIKISVPISKRRSLRCDRTYFIIAGKAEFKFGNKEKIIKTGEAIRIPKKTTYSYRPIGTIELVEINLPPYKEEYEDVDL